MISQQASLADFLSEVYCPGHLGIGRGSIRQMEIAVRIFCRWAARQVLVSELSDDLLLRFLSEYSSNRSRSTVNAKRRLLLALWRYAHRKGFAAELPRDVPRMKEYLREPEGWSIDEIERIIVEARKEKGIIAGLPAKRWWSSLLLSIYSSGERIGALRQVQWSDVCLAGRGILVRGETRKNGRDKWCPLTNEAVAACAAIAYPERKLFWPWSFSREWLERRLKRILQRASVRYGRRAGGLFNKFRRSAGSHIESNGGDGSKHLGNTRAVFERHYRDSRLCGRGQIEHLPTLQIDSPSITGCPAWALD